MKTSSRSRFQLDDFDDSAPPLSEASAAGIFAEGSRFGAYVIGPCIGHGGMARIYRAEHEGLRRHVALKVLTNGVGDGTEGRARFLREARIAAAIKHPNVVNIYDVGVQGRVPYLVMELLVGQDLEALLHSCGALGEAAIVSLMVPVVAGLIAVHDAGVVHRDLKPGNIFLSRGSNDEIEPKLLDFGISKAAGADKLRLTSATRSLIGTPLYMSPEALLGAEMNALSDQYSLGVVLYECATGINPFAADNVAETAQRVINGHYLPVSEQAIRPSKRLAAIIDRAMSLDPADRYPDLRALGRELLTLADERTRVTWELTFGEVAAAARARHVLAIERQSSAALAVPLRRKTLGRDDSVRWATVGLLGAGTLAVLGWLVLHEPVPKASPWYQPRSGLVLQSLTPGAGGLPNPQELRRLPAALASPASLLGRENGPASDIRAASSTGVGEDDSPVSADGAMSRRVDTVDTPSPRASVAAPPAPSRAQSAGSEFPTGAPARARPARGPRGRLLVGTNGAPIFD